MPRPPISCRELDLLVHEALHVHNEHARATADSVRRKLRARLLELEARFERTLAEEVPDEALRRAWRDHLHARGPAPSKPSAHTAVLGQPSRIRTPSPSERMPSNTNPPQN